MGVEKPKRFSKPQLEKVNVEIINRNTAMLKCKDCHTTWSPNLLPGGYLPKNYWHCPKGCNH